jgi:hypothetical protein
MTARTAFAAALAASAIAAPAAVAAPDLSQMAIAPTDLPSGTTVFEEGSFSLGSGAREYDRYFKLRPSSGFVRLNSSVILTKHSRDAELLSLGARLVLRNTADGRGLAKFTAGELGLKARRVHVGKAKALNVGDGGGFTVSVRVNGKTAIVVGIFRIDRAVGEIDARGAHGPKGLLTRTRSVVRVAADRVRAGLSPQSLTVPTITGTAQVGSLLQATPGTWSDATSFAYTWQRCDAAGACAAISGATQPAYTVTATDSGSTLEVVVTAANAVGQTSVASASTPPVP